MPKTSRCGHCRKRFETPPSVNHKHCSIECRAAASAAKSRKTCDGCGQDFAKHPRRGDKQRFCTHRCSIDHLARQRRTAAQPASVRGARWIPLTRNAFALVDRADYEMISKFTWFLHHDGYAITKIGAASVTMHRMLFGHSTHKAPIDHVDRNRLNNRRANLRQVTGGQNRVNSKINENNTSGFRGVHQLDGKWCARIGYGLTRLYLGIYATPEAAAQAYDDAARSLFGEAAQLNFGASARAS